MKIETFKYNIYDIKLNPPLKISNQIIEQKKTILIKMTDIYGQTHYGEVSPLNGFSKETIEECENRIEEIFNPDSKYNIDNIEEFLGKFSEYPSLIFGFEQLLLFPKLIKENSSLMNKPVKLNALVGIMEEKKTIEKIEQYIKNGFNTIKLKIGRPDFKDDLNIIKMINKIFGSGINIRLDNNGSWSIEEAKHNLDELAIFNIEYVEQPVHQLEDIFDLNASSKIKIAPDESVLSFESGKQIVQSGEFEFLVLKPSVRLGIIGSLRLINIAIKMKVKIIISSAFETAIGRNTLLFLASLTNHNSAHGLALPLSGSDLIKTKVNYNLPQVDFAIDDLTKFNLVDF